MDSVPSTSEPHADCWIGFGVEQLKEIVMDFGALTAGAIVTRDSVPTLAAFAERCRQEYRARTGIELVIEVQPRKGGRR